MSLCSIHWRILLHGLISESSVTSLFLNHFLSPFIGPIISLWPHHLGTASAPNWSPYLVFAHIPIISSSCWQSHMSKTETCRCWTSGLKSFNRIPTLRTRQNLLYMEKRGPCNLDPTQCSHVTSCRA